MTTEPHLRHHPDAPEVIVASTVAAAPGHAVAIPVEVRHRGPRAAHLRVTVFGLDARWIPEPLDLGVLQPGESASIQVTVIPERGAMGAHYPFTIAAEATAVGARPVVGVAESVLALGAAERISMTITPPLPAGVFSTGIRVDITNPGDDTRDLTLLPDSASGITVRLRDRQVSVPGRRTVSVKGRVRVRKPTITGGHNTHTFTVAAQGTGAPEHAEATMRSKPLIGGSLRRAIALGLVIVAWIALAIVFIPKISDRFKQKNDVASVVQTEDGGAGSGSSAGDGSGGGADDGNGGGAGSGGADGSGGNGSGGSGAADEGADGSAAAGGYQLSGTVTGPAAEGSFVTLAPVALAGIDDGSLPQTQSTDQTPRAFRSSASDAIGKSVGPLAPAPRDGFRTTTITTGEKGEFTFSGVTAPGYYLLTIAKKGFTSQRFLINSETLAASQPLKVELVPGEGSLSGRVIGPDGSAIGAATIVVTDGTVTLQTSSVSASTQTGTPGTWSLDQVSTPGTYLVTASSPGLGSASKLVTLDASGKGTADLTLTAGLSSISGKVSGEDGLGQVGGLGGITVTATGGDVTRTATTVTAAAMRGAFVLPNLPAPGTYTLTFSGQGYLTQTREVTLGASAVTVNTTLSRADAVVSGMISGRDENGKAEGGLGGVGLTLASNDLTMKTMTTSGDGAGSFQFVGVPPGTYVLTATQFGRTSASTTVELNAAASKKVNLLLVADLGAELPANAHIRGQVTDSRTSGPLTCDRSVTAVAAADCVATVTVSAPKDPTKPAAGTVSYTTKATSALNFVYTIPPLDDPNNAGLPPGLYTVRISAPGYEDAITHVQVAQGQTAPAPPASLPALGIISGTVTTRVDKPSQASCVLAVPVGVTVPKDLPTSCTVATGGNTCTASGISGAQPCALTSQGGANEPPLGTYQIRGLKHGQYQMVLISQDPEYVYTVGTVPIVTLELGADGQFNAVLDRLGRINVSVVKVDAATGSPVPVKGASISATKQTGDGVASAGSVTSDDNGIAILKGLDGTYKVSGSFVENGQTITADATADPTGLNQTANVTLVIAKQSGPLVGRVVVDGGGSQPSAVGGVTVTVSGTVGYQGSTASTGSAQVKTTTNGCYAIVPAGWSDSISTLKGPNCTFAAGNADDQAAVGTLKNLLTGQPATLISDRVDVSVAALPNGIAGDTWTETYPATGQAIADCIAGGCGTDGRMIPDINVKASAMDVGSLALTIAGPTGFDPPAISGLHFTVISKPSNTGGVTLGASATADWGARTASGDGDLFQTTLTFADPQYGSASGKALPGRYKFQVTLTDFVTQSVDLVCPFMKTSCSFTTPDGAVPAPPNLSFTLNRLPAISVTIGPLSGPAVTNWTQASVSQTAGPSLGGVSVFNNPGSTDQSYFTFGGAQTKVVAAGTSYSFTLSIPGYGTTTVSVQCGSDYTITSPSCAANPTLTALPTFPTRVASGAAVTLVPANEPDSGNALSLSAVTASISPNPGSSIVVSVDSSGDVTWTDSRPGVLTGQVVPGDYTITYRRAGFVDTAVYLQCGSSCVLYRDAAHTTPLTGAAELAMLPRPAIDVAGTLDSPHAAGPFTFGSSSLTVYRIVGATSTKVSTASLSLGAGTVANDGSGTGTTASADISWLDTAQAFGGIAGLGTYKIVATVDGFQQGEVTIDCTSTSTSCSGTISLTGNPSSGALTVTKIPATNSPVQFVVSRPAGVPSVSLTEDPSGNGSLTWTQGTAPSGVITPGTYSITATLAGYESAVVGSGGTAEAANVISFTCGVGSCDFPQIVMVAPTKLVIEATGATDAKITLQRGAGGASSEVDTDDGTATFSNLSTSNLNVSSGTDNSYILGIKAAGYEFETGLSSGSSIVSCTNSGTTATPAGLKLMPGGTTTCTVTLQKLGAIAGRSIWESQSLDGTHTIGTEQIGGISVTATLLDDAGDPTSTSFTTTSAASAAGSGGQVGDFLLTGTTSNGGQGLAAGNWKIEATGVSGVFESFAGVVTIEDNSGTYSLAETSEDDATAAGLPALDIPASGPLLITLTPVHQELDIVFKAAGAQIAVPNVTVTLKDQLAAANGGPKTWKCVVASGAATPTPAGVCTLVGSGTSQKIQFDALSPGNYDIRMEFSGGQYSTVEYAAEVKPASTDSELVFTLDAQAGSISGALVDSAGQAISSFPAPGATITPYKWDCTPLGDSQCRAKKFDGTTDVPEVKTTTSTFSLSDLPSGEYQLLVTAAGYASKWSGYIKVTVGSPTPPPTIQLLPAQVKLSLIVKASDGTTTVNDGATVKLVPTDTAGDSLHQPVNTASPQMSIATGVATFNQLATGKYRVEVTGQSDAPFMSSTTLDISSAADGENLQKSVTLDQAKTTLTLSWGPLGCITLPTNGSSIALSLIRGSGPTAEAVSPAPSATVSIADAKATSVPLFLSPGSYSFAPDDSAPWELTGTDPSTFTITSGETTASPSAPVISTESPTGAAATVTVKVDDEATTATSFAATDSSGNAVPFTDNGNGTYTAACLNYGSSYTVTAGYTDNGSNTWAGSDTLAMPLDSAGSLDLSLVLTTVAVKLQFKVGNETGVTIDSGSLTVEDGNGDAAGVIAGPDSNGIYTISGLIMGVTYDVEASYTQPASDDDAADIIYNNPSPDTVDAPDEPNDDVTTIELSPSP